MMVAVALAEGTVTVVVGTVTVETMAKAEEREALEAAEEAAHRVAKAATKAVAYWAVAKGAGGSAPMASVRVTRSAREETPSKQHLEETELLKRV